jgi:dynactin 1
MYRLRDLTAEAEAESKRKILDLEKELDLTADLQCAPITM